MTAKLVIEQYSESGYEVCGPFGYSVMPEFVQVGIEPSGLSEIKAALASMAQSSIPSPRQIVTHITGINAEFVFDDDINIISSGIIIEGTFATQGATLVTFYAEIQTNDGTARFRSLPVSLYEIEASLDLVESNPESPVVLLSGGSAYGFGEEQFKLVREAISTHGFACALQDTQAATFQ